MIHGIPGNRVLKEGDIVSVDVGATWGGFTGDCAATFACGAISPTAQKLITVTEQSFYEGIKFARQGNRISDIGHAVQTYVESHGLDVYKRQGKEKRQGAAPAGRRASWKKAMVKLTADSKTIEFFEGMV